MVQRVFVVPSVQDDHISVYYNESANIFIVTALKDDISELSDLEEANKPGIYVLMGKKRRYVGQASGKIMSRLESHYVKKPWWNKVVFFGRTDGHLSKDQTDYLERTLIGRAVKSNYEVDNNNQGNTSYMNRLNTATAEKLLADVDGMFSSVLNLNLFEPVNKYNQKANDKAEDLTIYPGEHNVAIVGNIRIDGKTKSNLYRKVVAYLVKNYLDELTPIITSDKPTINEFIGMKPNVTEKGNHLAYPIKGTNYYVYTCLNVDSIKEEFNKMQNMINARLDYQF